MNWQKCELDYRQSGKRNFWKKRLKLNLFKDKTLRGSVILFANMIKNSIDASEKNDIVT